MMRQEAKDRIRSENDYRVNEKMDHFQSYQWKRLVEIQQIQLEMMNELRNGR